MTIASIENITECANERAPKYNLPPELVIERALYYATRADPTAQSAVDWAIEELKPKGMK